MAIVEQRFREFLGGAIEVWFGFETRNNTLSYFRCQNNSEYRVYVYCIEPVSGIEFRQIYEPFSGATTDVPSRYKKYDPGSLTWGAGQAD